MGTALVDLQNDVLSRLNESGNSPAGRMPDGVGGTTETTVAAITRYLNDEAADLCRECYPIVDKGTVSNATGIIPLASIVCTSGNTLWAARRVLWNGVELDHASRSMLELDPSLETAGTPLYWYDQGADGVGILPPPSGSGTVTVYGLAIPVAIPTGGPSWLAPDLAKILVFGAAAMFARKNLQNTALGPRADVWEAEATKRKEALLIRLWQTDPDLANAHYPRPMAPGK